LVAVLVTRTANTEFFFGLEMIRVEGLTKYYGNHPAIQDLTFHASRGEILGFLGPNAAGKTTTMRILAGYMPPTEGIAKIADFDVIADSLEVRKRIGYLPETVPLYPEMSIWEYLEYMGSLRKVKDLDDRIEVVIDEVHLVGREESFIGNLSKGLRQRVGLAQALLHEPDVLILDEPTIGLDPGQIIEVRKLIQDLGNERTVLLSTHILSEAQQVCDRVIIINHGQLVAEDTPGNLQAQFAGADTIVLRASTDTKTLIEMLDNLSQIGDVKAGAVEGEVLVNGTPGKDIRPLLAKQIVEAGIDLLELRSKRVSLEDIFLQLTQDPELVEDGAEE
jgi:ABC-2 type transport system ATP-binding protein